MRKYILLGLVLLSFNSFAATMAKEVSAYASWSINLKTKDGNFEAHLRETRAECKDCSPEIQMKISDLLDIKQHLNCFEDHKFKSADESSAAEVEKLFLECVRKDDLKRNVWVRESSLSNTDSFLVVCKKGDGLWRNVLSCSGIFSAGGLYETVE